MRQVMIALALVTLPAVANEQAVRFFDSDGVEIAYRVDGDGPPVILIHGFLVDANMNWRMRGITETLAGNFQVISLDVRGHGQSEKPRNRAAYGVHLVEDVVRLMDHLQIERARGRLFHGR